MDRVTLNELEDGGRLHSQIGRIFNLMKDGKKRTLPEISKATGALQTSVSAALRKFRTEEWGFNELEKDSRPGTHLLDYWLVLGGAARSKIVPPEESRRPKRVLLCVDMSYQVYRAAAAHPNLTSRRVFTGGLYGFLLTFGKMVRETRATHVAYCLDSKPYKRSLVYPEYKQLRKKNADDELLRMYQESMELVLEVFGMLGLRPWSVPGFESDDLVGHCVAKYRHRFDAIYAGSNDSDLFQLFGVPNFHVYRDSIANLMNGDALMKNTGLTPAQFMLMTAITGTHNDIAGLDGVGPVTAKKAIADPALMRKLREKDNGGAVIDRNLGLIKLPHPDFPRGIALPRDHARFNNRNLVRALAIYDIDTTGSMVQAFEQLHG